MDRDELVRRLMATYLDEIDEHARTMERGLLALEGGSEGAERSEILASLFRAAHSLKGASRSVGVSVVESACHSLEGLLAALRDGRRAFDPPLVHLLYSTVDGLREVGACLREGQDVSRARLGALLRTLEQAASGAALATGREPDVPQVAAPVGGTELDVPAVAAPSAPARSSTSSVRVSVERLDGLLARGDELLMARRRLEAHCESVADLQDAVAQCRRDCQKILSRAAGNGAYRAARHARTAACDSRMARERVYHRLWQLEQGLERFRATLAADLHALDVAAGALDESIRRVRLMPFALACEGIDRALRDVASAAGKEVDLSIEGGAVEVDRSIIERLRDPLLHLVRNAVDHGVEAPAQRVRAGKARRARVRVAAALGGGHFEVVVEDDGAGIDIERVRARARAAGLPEPSDMREALRLVMTPGFSTAKVLTTVSGRGIGLDIVRRQIEEMRGALEIASEPGRGTRVLLMLPPTVTTAVALLVRAGGQEFALIGGVKRLLRVDVAQFASVAGREIVRVEGRPVPVVALSAALGIVAMQPTRQDSTLSLVLIESAEREVAIVVDELLATREVVIKTLGPRLPRVRNIAGATVLPDGRVALVVQTADLARAALGAEKGATLAAILGTRPSGAERSKRRLLIADDSVTTRTLERTILEGAGYEVQVAGDGIEAMRLLEERGADLVIADVEMPRMTGIELVESLRASPRFRKLPVILVTALASQEDRARGLAAGADAYLTKGAFDQSALLDTITQLLP